MRAADTVPIGQPEVERATTSHSLPAPSSRSSDAGAPGILARWVQFLTGLLAIFAIVFGVLPAAQRLGPVRDVHEAIERSGIDATALFYSEIDVSSEAELSIRDALRFPARPVDD